MNEPAARPSRLPHSVENDRSERGATAGLDGPPRGASESFDAPHAPLIATIAVDLALAYFLGALTTRLRLAPLVG